MDETIPISSKGYKSEDNKGKYRLVKLAKWGSAAKREDRPTMYFSLTSPDKKRFILLRLMELLADGELEERK